MVFVHMIWDVYGCIQRCMYGLCCLFKNEEMNIWIMMSTLAGRHNVKPMAMSTLGRLKLSLTFIISTWQHKWYLIISQWQFNSLNIFITCTDVCWTWTKQMISGLSSQHMSEFLLIWLAQKTQIQQHTHKWMCHFPYSTKVSRYSSVLWVHTCK